MNASTQYRPAPAKELRVTWREVIDAQLALAMLLDEETKFMDDMQITKVGELQDRKLKLTALLERYTRILKQSPEMLASITPSEKDDYEKVAGHFKSAVQRNYNTLLIARSVNRTVVECVTKAVADKDRNPVYDLRGKANQSYRAPISVTLNKTI